MPPTVSELATLGGGCFWCLQPVFEALRGVESVECGYSGGDLPHPTYEQVCTGRTAHAEVAQVRFDPAVLAYEDLLRVFFSVHDPTTLNRQGSDIGAQYRSVIFTHTPGQKAAATAVVEEITREKWYQDPVVTEIVPLKAFYRAEPYHQDYYRRNPGAGYCRAVIAPKVAKFRKEWRERLRE